MTHYWIIVEASSVEDTNDVCEMLGFGENNFVEKLYNSEEQLTAYFTGWNLTEAEKAILQDNIQADYYLSSEISEEQLLRNLNLHKVRSGYNEI